jgi:hypothetical protein
LPDRTPDPVGGERQRYSLPDEYGPARHPIGNDDDLDRFDDTTPAVTLHGPDAAAPNGRTAAPTEPVEAVAPVTPARARRSTRREPRVRRAPSGGIRTARAQTGGYEQTKKN